jgi:hypothetical protein
LNFPPFLQEMVQYRVEICETICFATPIEI